MDEGATKRYVAAAATQARKEVEAKYADQQWTVPVDDLKLSAERLQELRVLAQLPYSHPDIRRHCLVTRAQSARCRRACSSCAAPRSCPPPRSRSKNGSAREVCPL